MGVRGLAAAARRRRRRPPAGRVRPAPRARALSRSELALVAAAADTFFPPGGAVPPSGSEAGVPLYTDAYVAAVPAPMRRLMRALFLLVEHATLLFPAPPPRGFRRFSALSPGQREAVLEGYRTSRFFPRRLVFQSLRAALTMGYFADPQVLRRLRLAPRAIASPLREADLLYPPVGGRPEAIRWTRADLAPPEPEPPLGPEGTLDPRYAEGAG